MPVKKEAVEIKCSCGAKFRVWIPIELLSEWGGGEEINCIKCGLRYAIKKGKEGVEVSAAKAAAPAAPPIEAPPPPAPAEGISKVLFVDDDKLAIAIAQHTLADLKIEFITARSGEEALKKLEADGFSLLITDLHLKDPSNPAAQLDGEDVLKKLAESGKVIPALVTTGKDLIDDLQLDPKWFDLRVRGFVQKGNPFWAEELKTKMKELLDLV
jgi:CheY-like chemotaxis protein